MFLDIGNELINAAHIARVAHLPSNGLHGSPRVYISFLDREGITANLDIDEAKRQLTQQLVPLSAPCLMTTVSIIKNNLTSAILWYNTRMIAAFRYSPSENGFTPVDTNGETPEAGHFVVHQQDGSVLNFNGQYSSLDAWKTVIQKDLEKNGRTVTEEPRPFYDWEEAC